MIPAMIAIKTVKIETAIIISIKVKPLKARGEMNLTLLNPG
jgi:hypothetical protein